MSLLLNSGVPIRLIARLPWLPIPSACIATFGRATEATAVDGVLVAPIAGSKNSPLSTAFGPAKSVIVIFTCPLTVQTSYTPLPNDESVSVSSTDPVVASVIVIVSLRLRWSQSSA